MKLAMRIDEVERKQRKGRADSGWARAHAEEAGIELSESESDNDDGEGQVGRHAGEGGRCRGDTPFSMFLFIIGPLLTVTFAITYNLPPPPPPLSLFP